MRIGITGTGTKTCLGDSSGGCHQALCDGRDGNAPLQAFDADKFNCKHAYEIRDRNGSDTPYRASAWLTEVVRDAVQDAAVDLSGKRVAVIVGTGLRELRSVELWYNQGTPIRLDRLHFVEAASRALPFSVPVYTFCNACSASNFALGIALDMLEADELDVAIAAGVDSITESMFGLLDRVNPLHPQYLRSFNKDRRGVIMGEGAAAVVLEKDPAARTQAWLRGVGFSCDAYQDTAPHQDGLVAAMRSASERSGLTPSDIELLFVHGTGTIMNDQVEALAVREFFGPHLDRIAVTGIKPSIGHTSGASGLVSVIMAIESLRRGTAPAIFGLSDPIEEAKGMNLVARPIAVGAMRNIQVNAFGFGGVNAVAHLSRS